MTFKNCQKPQEAIQMNFKSTLAKNWVVTNNLDQTCKMSFESRPNWFSWHERNCKVGCLWPLKMALLHLKWGVLLVDDKFLFLRIVFMKVTHGIISYSKVPNKRNNDKKIQEKGFKIDLGFWAFCFIKTNEKTTFTLIWYIRVVQHLLTSAQKNTLINSPLILLYQGTTK